jgi:hypothetical protein
MDSFTAWSIVAVTLFILIGISVFVTKSLVPLWLAILPFIVTVKSGDEDA